LLLFLHLPDLEANRRRALAVGKNEKRREQIPPFLFDGLLAVA
jgi:hypothetical protein